MSAQCPVRWGKRSNCPLAPSLCDPTSPSRRTFRVHSYGRPTAVPCDKAQEDGGRAPGHSTLGPGGHRRAGNPANTVWGYLGLGSNRRRPACSQKLCSHARSTGLTCPVHRTSASQAKPHHRRRRGQTRPGRCPQQPRPGLHLPRHWHRLCPETLCPELSGGPGVYAQPLGLCPGGSALPQPIRLARRWGTTVI